MNAQAMNKRKRLNIFSFGNAILASAMVVCFIAALFRMLSMFDIVWVEELLSIRRELAIGVFLVALEVQGTRRLFEQHPIFSREWLSAIALEWGSWGILLLAAVWIRFGPRITVRELPALAELSARVVAQPEFLEVLVLWLLTWSLSRYLAADLMALENIPASTVKEALRGELEEQHAARNRLWQDVFLFGGIMVVLSVFSLPVANFIGGRPMDFGTLGLEILVFFLCGLGLFVIGRLMLLQAEWLTEQTGMDVRLPRMWIGYGLLFVLALLVLAAVLPTEYSFRLLASLNLVLVGVSTLITTLWILGTYLVVSLLSLIMPAWTGTLDLAQLRPPEDELAESLPALPQGIHWGTVVREIVFWGMAVLVAIYIVRQILRMRVSIMRRLRRVRLIRRILNLLIKWKRRWVAWKNSAAQGVRKTLQAFREDLARRVGREPWGFFRIRALDPRQMIRFYFFALLRRGAESGTARLPSQTPREYLAVLSGKQEPIREELRELTQAFEESRYTLHPLGPEKARRVRKAWNAIRMALRFTRSEGRSDRRNIDRRQSA